MHIWCYSDYISRRSCASWSCCSVIERYLMVVMMLLCPNNFWIVRRFVPCSNKRQANQCLNWWACRCLIQAFFAHEWIILLNPLCERCERKDFHFLFTNTYSHASFHLTARYLSRAFLTAGTRKTILWCPHFPENITLFQSISESFKRISSADLNQQPYRVNKIARFLSQRNVRSQSIASISFLNCSRLIESWGFDLIFGSVIAS